MPFIWSKWLVSSCMVMNELDMRLALVSLLWLMTTVMESAEYCRTFSCQIIGCLNSRARESKSLYNNESQATCMSFLNIFTLPSAVRKPTLVVSFGSATAMESAATASESPAMARESFISRESLTPKESFNAIESLTPRESFNDRESLIPRESFNDRESA